MIFMRPICIVSNPTKSPLCTLTRPEPEKPTQSKSLLNLKHTHTHTRHNDPKFPMKMGSLSLASILANGCRSPSSRVALLRTLATTHAALSKHYNKNVVACSSGCSQSKLSACESSSPDVTHNAPVEGYVLFHIFIAYMLLGSCNIGRLFMGCHKFCLHFGWLLIKLRKNT